jgi:hypothetical protein
MQLSVQGTNLDVTPQQNGSAVVRAKVGNATVDWLVVWSLSVLFPTNEWFAPLGGRQFFSVPVQPPFLSSRVSFTSSDPSVVLVSASGVPNRVAVDGLGNGSALVLALVEGVQACGSKSVSTFRYDGLRFQKPTMGGAWKNIDQPYKFLGVFTGQSVTFGVVTTPPGVPLPSNAVVWSGAASGKGSQTSVTFGQAGTAQIVGTIGTVAKSASAEVIDRPSGIGEEAYAALHLAYSTIATLRNLIGPNPSVLEPFVWASTNYPGLAGRNTKADAARHAYWSCLLTRYTIAGYAEGITTQHEVSVPGPSTETVMDLHNNAIGIGLASNHAHGPNNACCQAAVVQAVNLGFLLYLDASYGVLDAPEGTLLQPTNR